MVTLEMKKYHIISYHSAAQMCTLEYVLAYILGAPSIDDVMSYNSLTTLVMLQIIESSWQDQLRTLKQRKFEQL